MMSGACPPPAPSVWYAWIGRPAIAARVSSTNPASLSVSVWIAVCTPAADRDPQAGVDRGRRGAPVLVQLEPGRAGPQLLPQRLFRDRVALAEQHDVDRPGVGRLEHPREVPRARGDRGGLGALGRAGAAADQRGDAAAEGLGELGGRDHVDVAVDAAGGQDQPVARHYLGGRADHEVGVDAVHDVGVAGLADRGDPAVADPDVGLDDAPVVEDDRAGDDQIGRPRGPAGDRLPHRLADDLPAAEHGLVAPGAQVPLDLDEQRGVGQPDPVTRRRPVQQRVPLPAQLTH